MNAVYCVIESDCCILRSKNRILVSFEYLNIECVSQLLNGVFRGKSHDVLRPYMWFVSHVTVKVAMNAMFRSNLNGRKIAHWNVVHFLIHLGHVTGKRFILLQRSAGKGVHAIIYHNGLIFLYRFQNGRFEFAWLLLLYLSISTQRAKKRLAVHFWGRSWEIYEIYCRDRRILPVFAAVLILAMLVFFYTKFHLTGFQNFSIWYAVK